MIILGLLLALSPFILLILIAIEKIDMEIDILLTFSISAFLSGLLMITYDTSSPVKVSTLSEKIINIYSEDIHDSVKLIERVRVYTPLRKGSISKQRVDTTYSLIID